jgi:tryptophan synthase alpha chain
MSAISERLGQLRAAGECALIPFITAGDPDLTVTEQALLALDRHGADVIELGVPYSDPLADGPVIQAAATRALQQGTTLEQVLALLGRLKPQLHAPIVLFTYYNPILNRGVEAFLDAVATAGVSGLVVPDLPLEESATLSQQAAQRNLDLVLLVAPTSSQERIGAIARQSQGFIYLVSVTGVTGIRQDIQSRVKDLLASLRQVTDKPIGVGFGISSPEQARQMQEWGADAVIVGSALVKRLAEEGVPGLTHLCADLKGAIARRVGAEPITPAQI